MKVEVEEVPAILDVESAVAARSFYDNVGPPAMTTAHQIQSGNVKAAREAVQKALAAPAAASDSSSGDSGSSDLVVVTGEMRVGGQEHFYLEPNASLAVPSEVRHAWPLHSLVLLCILFSLFVFLSYLSIRAAKKCASILPPKTRSRLKTSPPWSWAYKPTRYYYERI